MKKLLTFLLLSPSLAAMQSLTDIIDIEEAGALATGFDAFERKSNREEKSIQDLFLETEIPQRKAQSSQEPVTKVTTIFECPECDYTTNEKRRFQRHMDTHAESDLAAMESLTDLIATKEAGAIATGFDAFRKKSKLEQEQAIQDVLFNAELPEIDVNRARPFKCPRCNATSITKGDLKKHIQIHTGKKPFKCQECDYASNYCSNLERHMKIHSESERFQCPHCNKSYSQKGNLKTHMRVHRKTSGEK